MNNIDNKHTRHILLTLCIIVNVVTNINSKLTYRTLAYICLNSGAQGAVAYM